MQKRERFRCDILALELQKHETILHSHILTSETIFTVHLNRTQL